MSEKEKSKQKRKEKKKTEDIKDLDSPSHWSVSANRISWQARGRGGAPGGGPPSPPEDETRVVNLPIKRRQGGDQ